MFSLTSLFGPISRNTDGFMFDDIVEGYISGSAVRDYTQEIDQYGRCRVRYMMSPKKIETAVIITSVDRPDKVLFFHMVPELYFVLEIVTKTTKFRVSNPFDMRNSYHILPLFTYTVS